MSVGKKRSEQHLVDQDGEALLRSKLPRHWILREYRPDYGLDFTIEVFKASPGEAGRPTYETLGEHVFVQLKSAASPDLHKLKIYGRGNVEKSPEQLVKDDEVAEIDVYHHQLETSELVTVERMGIAVPVLLVIADVSRERCSFVCLNDYIDKILIPRHGDYQTVASRRIHVPSWIEVGTEPGFLALKWYAKRAKLLAAFQRFTYQYSELQRHAGDDWRTLAEVFAERITRYDFWNDTLMCRPIEHWGKRVQQFRDTGQAGCFDFESLPASFSDEEQLEFFKKQDVFELWRVLSLLPRTFEDVWREWFLPTALGHAASHPDGVLGA